MAVTLERVRKAVVIAWDTNEVKGAKATILASRPDGAQVVEKKTVVNKGSGALSFPAGYHGACYIEVHGAKGGTDTGTIHV